MKIVKYLAVVFMLIVCCCGSCIKEPKSFSHVLIQNRTDNTIRVVMYFKDCHGTVGTGRYSCLHENVEQRSNKSGGIEWSEVKYITQDLDIVPHAAVLNTFDSIHIITPDNVIIFTHDKVTGYSENIFDENSTWYFQAEVNYDKPTYRWQEPSMYYKHIFLILEDKMIINKEE